MVRVRKLVLAIAAASAMTSGAAHALGLGEVTLKSSLSQPLVAEIELLEVRDLGTTEVIPTLASPEEFNKAGVDRQYFLTDLKFTPVIKPNGKSVIRITSSKPVREPYLNFLVEVLWPNGRLLREYTLLLDPPMYSPQPVVAAAPRLPVSAPVSAPAPRPQSVAPTPRPVAPAAPAAPRPTPAASTAAQISGDQYKTTSNDTLWEIAQRSRHSGSVHQAMLAIQELNPNAFVDGNINRLKSGQVLRLPDEQQVKSRSQAQAIAQVTEQNTAWREGRSLAATGTRQLDATKRSEAGAAPAKAESKDSLKLVAAESGKSAGGSEKGAGDSKALNDQLAVTKESLDSTRRENEELKDRMGDLQGQLDKLQKLIELKDNQLAKLQGDLANQSKVVPAATAPVAPSVPVEAKTPVESKPVEAKAPVTEPKVETPKPATPDYNYSEEPAPKVEPVKPVAVAPAKPAEVVKPEKPPVKKPVVVQEPAPTSFIDDLMANPMLLGALGGGALLALLVGLMVVSRRNAMKEAELQESLASDDVSASPFEADLDMPEDSFAGLDSASSDTEVREQERVAPQTADALGEADIYIAYGKFSQAAELLQNAINDEPQRSDLRLKLMEVYAELGDRDGFARQEQELREIGGGAAAVDQLKAKYPAMVVGAAAGMAALDDLDSFSLDDLTLDEPAAPSKGADLDDAFDLSLDDLDSDLQEAAKSNEADLDELSLDLPVAESSAAADLDFDLDLGADNTADALELGDDLADFSLDLEADSKPAELAEDDFMLSLEDEPAVSLSSAPAEAELDMSADFDLSLADEPVASAPAADSFAAQLDEVSAELEQLSGGLDEPLLADELPMAAVPESAATGLDMDDDFDFLSGTDETATKLDLARAYIDMGDAEGARDILDEVVAEGNEGQQQEARELISKLV
ncbi:FimV family protein [Aquipseudomonas campi]|uniref:FimV family protein n=1 Tax=Aquipseudomonas campi TaxID=2731681 RepID=A0A6M8FHD0_9GAMM|nr:FimV family protein [Pseudomonas campi]QKE63732.1 FimV family protein [Pseudomonas campi]